MKFKYFLRGLGVGIIFSSIICIVAFQSADSRQLSDKEVIERAKELGLVEKEDSVKDMFSTKESQTEEQLIEKKRSEEDKTTKITTEQKTTKEKTTETTTEQKSTEKKATEATTETATEKKTTEERTTETTTEKKTTVTITIKGGMSSYPVCQMLQELGVIKDATDFDNYLIKNGYANRISVGTHTLKIGMSYEEIAVAISDP